MKTTTGCKLCHKPLGRFQFAYIGYCQRCRKLIEREDGMKAENQQDLVERFVIESAIGNPYYARQGRHTFATLEEAVTRIEAIYAVNTKETVPTGLHVMRWGCYPGHFDPCRRSDKQPRSGKPKCCIQIKGVYQGIRPRDEAAALLRKHRQPRLRLSCSMLRVDGGEKIYFADRGNVTVMVMPGYYPPDTRLEVPA